VQHSAALFLPLGVELATSLHDAHA
jgi:hypothetical protein